MVQSVSENALVGDADGGMLTLSPEALHGGISRPSGGGGGGMKAPRWDPTGDVGVARRQGWSCLKWLSWAGGVSYWSSLWLGRSVCAVQGRGR